MKPLTPEEMRAMFLTVSEQDDIRNASPEDWFSCKYCGHRVCVGWVICPSCNNLVGHKPEAVEDEASGGKDGMSQQ